MAAVQLDLKEAVAIVLSVGTLLVTLFTPAMANFVLWLIETKAPDRFAAILYRMYEKKEYQARRKEAIEAMFVPEMTEIRDWGEMARANKDRIEAVFEVVKLHGAEMKQIRTLVKDVPTIGPALRQVGEAVQRMTEGMEAVNVSVARIDERQKLMWPIIEQRQRQEQNAPRRRSADYDEGDRRD